MCLVERTCEESDAYVQYHIEGPRCGAEHSLVWGAKDQLLGQLAIDKPDPCYIHASQKLPREWCEQLTAEQRVLIKLNGKDVYRWVKRRPHDEVLDCCNYALHAAMCIGIHKWSEVRWL